MESPPLKEVQIIEANLQNLEQLTDIARRSFLQAYPQNTDHENMELYLKRTFTESAFKKQLLNPEAIFYLMKFKNEISGYAKLRWDRAIDHFKNEKAIELERLYFLNEFKGKGLGSKLLQFCIDFSVNKNFKWMWLLVWEENVSGIQFYKKKGFEVFGRKTFHLGNDSSEDILMKHKL